MNKVVNNNILKHTLTIPKGAYALALFHDSNSNGILDKNFLGIPSERYGFSNNVHPLFSEPSFSSTVIEIYKDLIKIESYITNRERKGE